MVARMRDERDRRRVFVWLSDTGRTSAHAHPRVLADDALKRAVHAMRPTDRAAAEESTVRYMRSMPAWRDHPRLADR